MRFAGFVPLKIIGIGILLREFAWGESAIGEASGSKEEEDCAINEPYPPIPPFDWEEEAEMGIEGQNEEMRPGAAEATICGSIWPPWEETEPEGDEDESDGAENADLGAPLFGSAKTKEEDEVGEEDASSWGWAEGADDSERK